jgi:sulfur carrier protein
MHVFINDLKVELKEPVTPNRIFDYLQISNTNGYAIAVNNRVINRSLWTEKQLENNDKIIVIQATQGG